VPSFVPDLFKAVAFSHGVHTLVESETVTGEGKSSNLIIVPVFGL